MKTLSLKEIAVASAAFMMLSGTAYAVQIGTGSVVGGSAFPINSTWIGGTADPTGSTASGNTTVAVTATVAPTLVMDLDAATLALGTLNTDGVTYKTAGLTVTGATNSINGMNVAIGSLGLSYSGQTIGTYRSAGNFTADATDRYRISTAAVPNFSATTAIGTDSAEVLVTQNVYTSASPVAPTATLVTIGAVAGITTPAGNYADTLTFTVTSNF